MNYYIDIEATQPQREIIAIGITNDNGDSFYSLVKPTFSKITPIVSELTHITAKELTQAKPIDDVLDSLAIWFAERQVDYINDNFYSYGTDIDYFKATLPAIKTQSSYFLASVLMTKIEDITKYVFNYFQGAVSLINAYNYINQLENKQEHNALEDAKMLRAIAGWMENNTPLLTRPKFTSARLYPKGEITGNMPKGYFYARKGDEEIEFANIEEAIDWVTSDVPEKDKPNIHRNRVALKIVKAAKKHGFYKNYVWRRVKKKKEETQE